MPRRRLHAGMPARCKARLTAATWEDSAWYAGWKLDGWLQTGVQQWQPALHSTIYSDSLSAACDLYRLAVVNNYPVMLSRTYGPRTKTKTCGLRTRTCGPRTSTKLVNWSSRILEDKDFPRGQQNSNYHYCSVPKVSHTTPNGRPSSVNVQSPNRHHLLISKSWSLFSCTCSSSVVTNSITLIFLSQNQESLIFICITLHLESTPCFIPSSHILTISLHSPRLTCSIITTLTINHFHSHKSS